MSLTPESFIDAFRKRHHWKCETGKKITDDLTDFANERLGSSRNVDELYVIFCLSHRLTPYPPLESNLMEPETVEKIKDRKYECFIEDHEPKLWTPGQCAGYAGRSVHLMRCKRKGGHGIGNLFCSQHAKTNGY